MVILSQIITHDLIVCLTFLKLFWLNLKFCDFSFPEINLNRIKSESSRPLFLQDKCHNLVQLLTPYILSQLVDHNSPDTLCYGLHICYVETGANDKR